MSTFINPNLSRSESISPDHTIQALKWKEREQTEGISCAKALWLETSVAGAERARDRTVGGEADVSTRDCLCRALQAG